jgi:hypothetical protein
VLFLFAAVMVAASSASRLARHCRNSARTRREPPPPPSLACHRVGPGDGVYLVLILGCWSMR